MRSVPVVLKLSILAAGLTAAGASRAAAQVIVGRATDANGTPLAHVRVLVHPANDSSDAAMRAVITNARGEFRVPVGAAGAFVLNARRIGYRAETTTRVTVGATGEARLELVLRALPLTLTAVTVQAPTCVALDSPEQSPEVREWVTHAQHMLRARRAMQDEHEYRIRMVSSSGGHESGATLKRSDTTWERRVGDQTRWPDDPGLSGGTGSQSGMVLWRIPNEAMLLSAEFVARLCFDNGFTETAAGARAVGFLEVAPRPYFVPVRGTFTLDTASAFFSEMTFELAHKGGLMFSGGVTYTTLMVDGDAIPMVSGRVRHDYMHNRGRERGHNEWTFSYSEFMRAFSR